MKSPGKLMGGRNSNLTPGKIINCIGWYDANNINGNGTSPVTGSNVSTWHDLSGRAAHLFVTEGGPTYNANVLNGNGAVSFISSDCLEGTVFATVNYTFFGIAMTGVGAVHQQYWGNGNGGSDGFGFGVTGLSHVLGSVYGGVGYVEDGAVPAGTYQRYSGSCDGSINKFSVNGVDQVVTNPNIVPNLAGTSIFMGDQNKFSEGLSGNIGELIIYSRALYPREITSVNNYLLNKWGF